MKVFKYIFKQKLLITITILLLVIESLCTFATPYISSVVIDYGIEQNGIVVATPSTLDPYSYRFMIRVLDGQDKSIVEKSYDKYEKDYIFYNDNDEKIYYEINSYGLLHILQLENIFIGFGGFFDSPDSLDYINKYGGPDSTNVNEGDLDIVRRDVYQYAESHSTLDMYKSAINSKIAENNYLGFDKGWYQVNFVVGMSIVMIIVVILYLFATILGTYLASRISFSISRDLRRKQFDKVMSFSNHDIDKFSRASLITRASNDLQVVQNTSVFVIRSILIAPLMLIIGFAMAMLTAPSLAWIIVVTMLAIFVLAIILIAIVAPKYKMVQKYIDKINSISRESISGVSIIRALNNEDFQESRFTEVNKKLYDNMLFAISMLVISMPILMLTVNLVTIAILWTGAAQLEAGILNIGQLIAFISYSTETIFAFVSIAIGFVMLPRSDVSLSRIEELLNHKIKIDNFNTETKKSNAKVKDNEYIKFENVSFKYDSANDTFIKDIDLKIKKNSINAIVGPTGSGKTTLLKLLLRYYDVSKGNVIINGINVKDYNETDLRNTISYVPQKVFLFEGTLEENVALNPNVKDSELIEQCLRLTNLGRFMDSNKEGMKYPVSEYGRNLSGGQKQRLTIARAVSEKLPILLLDDPFSALDANTENMINNSLQHKFKDVTILLVTQRLSSVVNYDNIILMEDGKVVCCGTHKELMKNSKDYKQAFSLAKSPTIREIK